eukprot:355400-Chlamydomonas_euryale.AAC.11
MEGRSLRPPVTPACPVSRPGKQCEHALCVRPHMHTYTTRHMCSVDAPWCRNRAAAPSAPLQSQRASTGHRMLVKHLPTATAHSAATAPAAAAAAAAAAAPPASPPLPPPLEVAPSGFPSGPDIASAAAAPVAAGLAAVAASGAMPAPDIALDFDPVLYAAAVAAVAVAANSPTAAVAAGSCNALSGTTAPRQKRRRSPFHTRRGGRRRPHSRLGTRAGAAPGVCEGDRRLINKQRFGLCHNRRLRQTFIQCGRLRTSMHACTQCCILIRRCRLHTSIHSYNAAGPHNAAGCMHPCIHSMTRPSLHVDLSVMRRPPWLRRACMQTCAAWHRDTQPHACKG